MLKTPAPIRPWLTTSRLSFLICVIVSGVLLLNTASTAIETAAPSVSLWLNPLNSEARLGAAIAKLQEEAQSVDPATRQLIKTGIALSPIDARFYSLMGIAEEQQGNLDEASRYYDRALTIAPAEIQALIHKLRFAINAGDYVEAVDYMEIIGRRWGYWPSMQAVLSFLMSDDRAFAEIADRFSNQAVLRALVFQNLDRSDDGLTRAQSLLLDWHSRGVPDLNDFINKTTSDLVRNKRYADAFELFRSTRKPQNEMPNDRIYNGSFELPPSGNGFDWQIRGQAGVDFTFLALEGANQSATTTQAGLQRPSKGTGLSIRFLNNPIQLRNVSQMILLEPGAYRLAVTFSTRDLRAPEPLRLGIKCIERNVFLGELSLDEETVKDATLTVDFSVPQTDCELQQVFLFNATLPKSWKYRYSGTLTLHRVSIASMES